MRLRNTRRETFNFSLLKEYEGIGRTLCVLGKKMTDDLPNEIVVEKEIRTAMSKGILVLMNEKISFSKPVVKEKVIEGKKEIKSFLARTKKGKKSGKGV